MKKNFIKFVIIFLFVFISIQIVFAVNKDGKSITNINVSNQIFGGKIINTKASKIQSLESSGYTCVVTGTTINIKPTKGPANYFIPFSTISKTGKTVSANKWILGKYSGKTTITCTKSCGETMCTDTATLDTITMFGTS